jgi:hypothetical protein
MNIERVMVCRVAVAYSGSVAGSGWVAVWLAVAGWQRLGGSGWVAEAGWQCGLTGDSGSWLVAVAVY